MTTAESTRDRQRGALIGLAVGDALGAAVEFKSPGSFSPVTGYQAGGPHGLNPGEWTDDTSMALALADSIVKGRCEKPGGSSSPCEETCEGEDL
jgi:ADP-ribosylglycohydrolase